MRAIFIRVAFVAMCTAAGMSSPIRAQGPTQDSAAAHRKNDSTNLVIVLVPQKTPVPRRQNADSANARSVLCVDGTRVPVLGGVQDLAALCSGHGGVKLVVIHADTASHRHVEDTSAASRPPGPP